MKRTFHNPILPGFYPDPSVARVGDDYFLVTSTFEYFPGVPIFHSRDLVTWRQIGHCLTREKQLPLQAAPSSKGIFAPTLRYHAGTFYLISTNVSDKGSFIVSAQDPAGEWSDPLWIQEQSWGMDPSLFFDDDGAVYYTRHGGGENGAAYQALIHLSGGTLDQEPREIWKGTGGVWPEGPHLYKINGTYYLLLAEGGTGFQHCITVARSSSPWGPFEACPRNPILTHRADRSLPIQATGHGDLVQTKDGAWWLVFLGTRPWNGKHHHLGRETFLASVEWDDEGWPVVNSGMPISLSSSSLALPAETPSHAAETATLWRDDFDAPRLAFEWNHLRNPDPVHVSLTARPGWLRLNGTRANLDEFVSPAFVGRRQQHYRARAATLLEFQAESEQHAAGLVVRADEKNHYDLLVTRDGAGRCVTLQTRVQGVKSLLASAPLAESCVELIVEAHADRYEFLYADGSSAARLLGTAPSLPLSSQLAGGFTGVYLGLYATAGSAGQAPPADFAWFEYEAKPTAS